MFNLWVSRYNTGSAGLHSVLERMRPISMPEHMEKKL